MIDEQLHSLARQHEQVYLERVAARIASDTVRTVCANPDDQDSVPLTLARYAAATDCDLIVMSSHGRGGFERFWLGSVAEGLIHCSHLPILLVRPLDAADSQRIERVLVALDGSSLAEQGIGPAQALAGLLSLPLALLRVVVPDGDADYAADEAEARHYLDQAAARYGTPGGPLETVLVVDQAPATAIVGAAQDTPHTLIVIATHGRRGVRSLLLGSVATEVLRDAPGPLLIVRPVVP